MFIGTYGCWSSVVVMELSQWFHKDVRKIASWEAAWPPQSRQLATFSGSPSCFSGGTGGLLPTFRRELHGVQKAGAPTLVSSAHTFPGREGAGEADSPFHAVRSRRRAGGGVRGASGATAALPDPGTP